MVREGVDRWGVWLGRHMGGKEREREREREKWREREREREHEREMYALSSDVRCTELQSTKVNKFATCAALSSDPQRSASVRPALR